jgi:hypothetical protein
MKGSLCCWCQKPTKGVLWLFQEIFVCTYCFTERRTLRISMRDGLEAQWP